MTKAAYARYKGVSKPMVTKWLNDGRLVLTDDDKRVLVNESNKRIKETVNLNNYANEMQAKAARVEVDKAIEDKSFTQLKTEVNDTQLDLATKDADTLFKNSRALREKAVALQASADYDKSMSLLVSRELVEKIMFERARACRDTLITSARRMSPVIVGKTDISEVESLLNDEYRMILDNFARMPIIE
ncbi:hypothetical protein [uncultured Paraglaciecola sp.]|uniref:hypothetical protein n=1 Tax=uncultured Paraglaciecola sp. TaxID=1765024 RepID=UPI002608D080|nr:hypothetical protein [uncultured Paraglaciecola sp.]